MDTFFILFLLACVGAVALIIFLRRGENLRFETGAARDRVMATAMSAFATKRNWEVVTSTDGSSSFNYRRGANKLLLVILLIPPITALGIAYWILSGKKETVNISAIAQGSGTMVQVASNGWRGKSAGRSIRSSIGVSGGTESLEAAGGMGTLEP